MDYQSPIEIFSYLLEKDLPKEERARLCKRGLTQLKATSEELEKAIQLICSQLSAPEVELLNKSASDVPPLAQAYQRTQMAYNFLWALWEVDD